MDKLERIVWIICQCAMSALLIILCTRICTGCTLTKSVSREKISVTLKNAYAEGGQTAVSNRIESLVLSGYLSRKQADKMHEVAQSLYERVIDKLDTEMLDCVDDNCSDGNCKDE